MSSAARCIALGAAAILVAGVIGAVPARGRGGGGAARGGARGGFNWGGPAAGGSFGSGRAAGGTDRAGFSNRGAAASGGFAGQQPSGVFGGGSVGGGQQIDRAAIAQRQRERFGRLGSPDAGGAAERQERRDAVREDRQQYAANRREDWQDYAEEHYDERYDGYPGTAAAVAAGVAVGAAVGAAEATPPYWTLSCVPNTVVVGGITYYQCGSAWYVRAYSGGDVAYTMVNPPAGY